MAEELQGLLERIQKDGIDKADSDATAIIDEAKAKAADIVAKAKADAASMLKKAEDDGAVFQKRGESAISQAARDVILSVRDSITAAFQAIISKDVHAALNKDDFPAIVKNAILAYCQNEKADNLEIIVSENQREQLAAYFMAEMADQIKNGLTIKGDRNIISGFTVSVKDEGLYHDFTGTTISDALGELLRPELASIIKQAATDA